MTYRIEWTVRARSEIRESAEWWAEHHSADEASRWFEGFIAAIEAASENPHACSIARENDLVDFELRYVAFGLGRRPTHRALVLIDTDERVMRVLTIRHVARDDVSTDDLED